MPDPHQLLRLPITFASSDGVAVHAPMVRATVRSMEMLFVLDTGSEVHILTRELADQVGLPLSEGEDGTDHAGATMPSWSAGTVEVEAAGVALPLADVVVIPAPAPFPGWGVGGILSPQHLRTDAAAVIDLVDDELLLVAGAAGTFDAWLAQRHPELTLLRLARDGRSPTPVVPAAIAPFDDTAAMLNTGGKHTEFDVTVLPELAPAAVGRLGAGVSGAEVRGSVIGAQTLVVAGASLPVAELALREGMTYPHALVGMDVLRGTVLTSDADPSGALRWQVPAR